MKRKMVWLLGLCCLFLLSGCVVRSYSVTKDRIDQDLNAGNRGYLNGQASEQETVERKTTRQMRVVEVEMHSPIRFEKAPKRRIESEREEAAVSTRSEDRKIYGNRGYIMQSKAPKEIAEAQEKSRSGKTEIYKVEKGDTLQKISKKFYGTTKGWMKIYNANKDTMKGPDKIYRGQALNIPEEGMKEPAENLK